MSEKNIQQVSVQQRIVKTIVLIGLYAFLGIMALIVLFPFYWMILTSVKGYGAYNSEYIPKLFTLSPTLENYLEAYKEAGYPMVSHSEQYRQAYKPAYRIVLESIFSKEYP